LHVILNASISLDGKIATKSGESRISSEVDLKRVHKLRASVDAILVGISTVIKDDPMLDVRYGAKYIKSPTRVILDSLARISLHSRILRTAKTINTIVAVTERASKGKIRKIESMDAQVLIAGHRIVNVRAVLKHLEKFGCKRILVEGGGEINWSILSQGLANEMIIMISSMVIGGRSARTLVEGSGHSHISDTLKMKLSKVKRQAPDELVLYYRSV
jgi:2,5-diamino-6-(ribosylamino)-4(3H)-pyrimidinone 5'-phosphate reductase